MIQSSLYVEGKAEGRAEGEAKGRLAEARELCAALARRHRPAAFDRVWRLIEVCEDPTLLKEWALAAADVDGLDDAQFLKLIES